jgi:hypothetical protein
VVAPCRHRSPAARRGVRVQVLDRPRLGDSCCPRCLRIRARAGAPGGGLQTERFPSRVRSSAFRRSHCHVLHHGLLRLPALWAVLVSVRVRTHGGGHHACVLPVAAVGPSRSVGDWCDGWVGHTLPAVHRVGQRAGADRLHDARSRGSLSRLFPSRLASLTPGSRCGRLVGPGHRGRRVFELGFSGRRQRPGWDRGGVVVLLGDPSPARGRFWGRSERHADRRARGIAEKGRSPAVGRHTPHRPRPDELGVAALYSRGRGGRPGA